jgi:hypothetical protein
VNAVFFILPTYYIRISFGEVWDLTYSQSNGLGREGKTKEGRRLWHYLALGAIKSLGEAKFNMAWGLRERELESAVVV